MSAPQVNGDIPSSSQSAFIQHLLKYPVIHDGVATFKQNQYGQKSLALGDQAYQTLAKPVLPYFARPYEYVSPYVKKADSIGDQTLAKIDEHFPVIKKPTGELYTDAKTIVFFPLRKGMEGKDHVVKTYSDACTKNGNDKSIATALRALVSTSFIIGNETLEFLGGFLHAKKNEAKTAVNH